MRLSSTFSQNRTVVSGAWHGARFLFFSGLFGILLVAGPAALRAQCPTVLAIMVDACGTEALNEFVIINSGGGFNTSNLQLSFDVNNNIIGPQNNDINIDINNLPGGPCGLQPGNPALIAGCANVIAVGPGVDIPANSTVVIQTSANADAVYDFAVVCGAGGCIYVIQNTCVRNAGGFTNGGGGGPRTTILAVSNLPGCFFSYVYNTTLLSGVNGDYFMPPPALEMPVAPRLP